MLMGKVENISIVFHKTVVYYVVGLQTILVGTIKKECPSGRTISIGAETLDLKEIFFRRAEIDEASGHRFEKILV